MITIYILCFYYRYCDYLFVKIVDSGLHFYFLFSLYFSFSFSLFSISIFRTTWVRVYQSRCHISHKLMASHKTDYKTWENRVEGSGIK